MKYKDDCTKCGGKVRTESIAAGIKLVICDLCGEVVVRRKIGKDIVEHKMTKGEGK